MEVQLKFVNTRNECSISMSKQLKSNDVEIHDTMRFMNGDKPAGEFECGNQKGGHHMSMADDYTYNKFTNHRTLEERKKLVLAGKMGEVKSVGPFKDLKRSQVEKELIRY